jgi:hypothetical protein
MSESEYKQYWTARVFRGETDAGPFDGSLRGHTERGPEALSGAISLVSVPEVKPGMKVIKVDGLTPGAAGYPLH